MFLLFNQDFIGEPLICFDGSGGIGNGSAGSAKQKALRRAVGKAGNGLQVKAFGKWLK